MALPAQLGQELVAECPMVVVPKGLARAVGYKWCFGPMGLTTAVTIGNGNHAHGAGVLHTHLTLRGHTRSTGVEGRV